MAGLLSQLLRSAFLETILVNMVALALLTLSTLSVAGSTKYQGNSTPQARPKHEDATARQAILALHDTLQEAKLYDDKALQVRVRTQIADILWESDPVLSGDLVQVALDGTKEPALSAATRYSLRSEIIRIVRKHDSRLASALIEQLAQDKKEEREVISRESIERITDRGALYLESARELAADGDIREAASLARRSLTEGRSSAFLSFLFGLREHDLAAADKLFIESVEIIGRVSIDPNDILLLGLYLFTRGQISFVDANGQLLVSHGINFGEAPHPPLTQVLPYLRAAAEVLKRFSVAGHTLNSTAPLMLKRFALEQLMPLYERYLPNESVALRAELSQMASIALPVTAGDIRPPFRDADSIPGAGLPTAETIKSIERVSGTRERDSLYFDAVINAIDRADFEQARSLTPRLSQVDLRRPLDELAGFLSARNLIEQGKLDEAEQLAKSQLTEDRLALTDQRIASAWMNRGQIARAATLINYASIESAKIDDRSRRAKVYIYLASGLVGHDVQRAFEFIEAAAKDINETDKFDINNGRMSFKIRKPNGAMYEKGFSSGASLIGILPNLARADLLRTLTIARWMRSEEHRANSVITICRAVLASKAKGADEKKVDKTHKPKS